MCLVFWWVESDKFLTLSSLDLYFSELSSKNTSTVFKIVKWDCTIFCNYHILFSNSNNVTIIWKRSLSWKSFTYCRYNSNWTVFGDHSRAYRLDKTMDQRSTIISGIYCSVSNSKSWTNRHWQVKANKDCGLHPTRVRIQTMLMWRTRRQQLTAPLDNLCHPLASWDPGCRQCCPIYKDKRSLVWECNLYRAYRILTLEWECSCSNNRWRWVLRIFTES